MLTSRLFAGETLPQSIADDQDRISFDRHADDPASAKLRSPSSPGTRAACQSAESTACLGRGRRPPVHRFKSSKVSARCSGR